MRPLSLPAGRLAAWLSPILLIGAAPTRQPSGIVDVSALRDKEELVLTVGDRLAVAAADLCAARAPALGLALHELSQYGPAYARAARAMFARPDLPAVLAVAQAGAAARAGVRAGDGVIAVDGRPVPPAGGDGLARVEAVAGAMERGAADGRIALTLWRDGRAIVREIAPPPGCAARFQVRPGAALEASANGWLIEATTGLIDFTRGPDELAAVLAHELAHNILRHRTRGAGAARRRAAELEADRLSVRLTHRAGFRAAAAAEFWRRMRARGGVGPSGRGGHPGDAERIRAVEAELRLLGAPRGSPDA